VKCPRCHFENREKVKFCEECGSRLSLLCPRCGMEVSIGRKFCGGCGQPLLSAWEAEEIAPAIVGERKQITVMFSDLTGYTRITEKMDPEEVKEIMGRIFGEITQLVEKYDGIVGRFMGDAAMILFGVPSSHEDDAVRAIRTAREIHSAVEALSLDYETKIGQTLTMHTGINSGLAVISKLDSDKVADEITGDTINLASRLCSLARAGTILVGLDTYRVTQSSFIFKRCEPTEVKGKSQPVEFYEVLGPRVRPETISRLYGFRSRLIGRGSEMDAFAKAADGLEQGQRTVIALSGDPGTGKTRLVEEFRATLDRQRFQWMTGHTYS
jgi:class 3 adenylate cyclase